jgi:hypothetical protein
MVLLQATAIPWRWDDAGRKKTAEAAPSGPTKLRGCQRRRPLPQFSDEAAEKTISAAPCRFREMARAWSVAATKTERSLGFDMLKPVLRLARVWWSLVVVAIVCGVGGCASAPATGSRPSGGSLVAADDYPLDPGWKWAYDVVKDGEPILAIYEVLERTPGTAILRLGDTRLVYAVTPEGIAQRDGAVTGDFVLKNPVAAGTSWNVMGGSARIAAVGQAVTVAAGTYADCVVVEALRTEPPRLTRTTFAPGVGPVVVEVQVQDQGRFVTTTRASLRGVTKPGEVL